MQVSLFNEQILRLVEKFGGKHFSDSDIKLIWKDVCYQSDYWFANLCDRFISTRSVTKPPLPIEFTTATKLRQPQIERQTNHDDFSFFNDGQRKVLHAFTRKVSRREISNQDMTLDFITEQLGKAISMRNHSLAQDLICEMAKLSGIEYGNKINEMPDGAA